MSMRSTGFYIIAAFFACAAAGPACAADDGSPVTANWGTAYKTAKEAQIEHPDAGKCIRPVTRFDGKAAELSVGSYQAEFGKRQAPQSYNINLGEISGVGMK